MGRDVVHHFCRRPLLLLILVAWFGVIAFGLSQMWRYQTTPGIAAQAHTAWPENSRVSRTADLPTLLLFLHPRCPCSRATLHELGTLMTPCHNKVNCTVLLLRPAGMPDKWERTDLWESAAAIPQVKVMVDSEGREARRFGAATSGQALLYSADGKLSYTGGLTASRGEDGDNAGRATLTSLILDNDHNRGDRLYREAVYGCALFDTSSKSPATGAHRCGK